MATLTKKQKEILDFIKKYSKENGVSPTFEEIREFFNLKALSGVHQHIDALEKKGFVEKTSHHSRAIQIIGQESMISIPLSGAIAAGQPIETIEEKEKINIPKSTLTNPGDFYALKVQGESMIGEGIFDGDVVIIKKQEYAENGQTVVAIINDNEATLKKLYKEKNRFRLQPANPNMLPIFTNELEIRGVVLKIIRDLESDIEEGGYLLERILSFSYTNNSKRKVKPNTNDYKPFLQWVGGKREMIKQYEKLFPKKFNNYFEPFLGGGAIFFHLKPKKAILNDNNKELIKAYLGVRDNPKEVIKYLNELKKRHSKNLYNEIRSIDRTIDLFELPNYEIAARMIYLNQTCFNGLYRVNQNGQFNVPIGSSLNRLICDEYAINKASEILKKAKIENSDFKKTISKAKSGDFVYIDPPYYPVSKYSDFTRYTKEKFYQKDQERLKESIDMLTKKKVKVLLSNSDCDFIRKIYSNYKIYKVKSSRNLNCKKNNRNKIFELVIKNY